MTDKPKTLTRADLSKAVHKKLEHGGSLSFQECSDLVDAVIEEVSSSLESGGAVKISSFGTILTRTKKQRVGRNPKTGVEVPITPRNVLSFNASNLLKARINKNLAGKNVELA